MVPAPVTVTDFLVAAAAAGAVCDGFEAGAEVDPATLVVELKRTLFPPLLEGDAAAATWLPLDLTFCLTAATISAAESPMGSGDPFETGDDPSVDSDC